MSRIGRARGGKDAASARIALAIDAVGAKHGGAATVLNAVIAAAVRSASVRRTIVFCSPASDRAFDLHADENLEAVDVRLGECGPAGRIAWQYGGLPLLARRRGADVLLCLSGGGVPPRRAPGVVFLQQSLPFCDEAMARLRVHERIRARMLGWNMRMAVRRSVGIAVQTSTMARWVRERFGAQHAEVRVFAPCPTMTESTGGAQQLKPMRESGELARVLYVGNGSAYKNLGVLAGAMERLRQQRIRVRLFATVPPAHPLAETAEVVALGQLPMSVVGEAYRLATVLVMPSLVETVGLPMLEAFQAGTPVVAADRPYAHDVCGDAAVYFDPHSADALARRLAEIVCDPLARERLSAAGRVVALARSEARPYDALVTWLVEVACRVGRVSPIACATEAAVRIP